MPNDSVLDLAGGDLAKARYLHRCLTRLAGGSKGPLRDLAGSVLRGQVSLRSAANSEAYGQDLSSAFGRFWSRYQAATPEARQQVIDLARQHLDRLTDDDTATGGQSSRQRRQRTPPGR